MAVSYLESLKSDCNRVQLRGGPQIGICNRVQKSLEIIGSTPQGHTCPECGQLGPVVGGAGNGAAEDDSRWDLNWGAAAVCISFWDHTARWDHTALEVLPFATWKVPGA